MPTLERTCLDINHEWHQWNAKDQLLISQAEYLVKNFRMFPVILGRQDLVVCFTQCTEVILLPEGSTRREQSDVCTPGLELFG